MDNIDIKYTCVKCQGHDYEHGRLFGASDAMAAVYNLETRKFMYISCKNCGYTEFYKKDLGLAFRILDMLVNR